MNLERSLQTDPDFALARLRLAQSLHAMGQETEAEKQVQALAPDLERLAESDRLLAQALEAFIAQGDFETGSRFLEELTAKYPNHGAAYVLWAEALDELADDPLRATRKLQAALKQDPNNLPAIIALAKHLERFGATGDAELILRQAADRNPDAAIP